MMILGFVAVAQTASTKSHFRVLFIALPLTCPIPTAANVRSLASPVNG